MNKIQKLHFRTVDDLLMYIPNAERKIVEVLRALILDAIPDVTEKLSYNVPFYFRHSRICFIWPASVPWGNVPQPGVQLGFCNGHLLSDDSGYLVRGNRKQVSGIHFKTVQEIDVDLVRSFLYEAVLVDEELQRGKLSSRKL